jgi:3-deoxy-D-manno-octulosonic-acid transferase
VPASRVVVAGNLKAEAAGTPDRLAFRPAWEKRVPRAPVWVAGSTHEGEEAIVLAAHRGLQATLPRAVLVLAPRHPRRVPAVRAEAFRAGFDPVLWSEERAVSPGGVLILDGLGLLPSCYARAGLVFVGGSLVPRGGHDPLEAARTGRPVLIGPYHAHCRDAVLSLGSAGALAVVADGEELVSRLETLLPDVEARARMGRRGALVVRRSRGAVLAAVLPPLLDLLRSTPADLAPLRGGGSG